MNPERLLGALLSNTLSDGRGRRSGARRMLRGSKGAIGMGLLGLALGAYEHFSANQDGQERGASAGGPPPPPGASTAPPPPPPVGAAAPESGSSQSILLLRAMIAAAHADWVVDAEERERIMREIQTGSFSAEDRQFLERELEKPMPINQLAEEAKRLRIERETYGASYLAVTADSEAERAYLKRLAGLLNLDEQDIRQIEEELEGQD